MKARLDAEEEEQKAKLDPKFIKKSEYYKLKRMIKRQAVETKINLQDVAMKGFERQNVQNRIKKSFGSYKSLFDFEIKMQVRAFHLYLDQK